MVIMWFYSIRLLANDGHVVVLIIGEAVKAINWWLVYFRCIANYWWVCVYVCPFYGIKRRCSVIWQNHKYCPYLDFLDGIEPPPKLKYHADIKVTCPMRLELLPTIKLKEHIFKYMFSYYFSVYSTLLHLSSFFCRYM